MHPNGAPPQEFPAANTPTTSNLQRGTFLQQALAAAGDGDVIILGPGTYETHGVTKDKVRLHMLPGAVIMSR